MNKSTCCVSTLAVCSLLLGGSLLAFGQQKHQDSTPTKPSINEQSFTIRERTELVTLTGKEVLETKTSVVLTSSVGEQESCDSLQTCRAGRMLFQRARYPFAPRFSRR